MIGMKKDKLKLYALEIVLITILFFALFVSNIFTRMVLSIILTIFALITTIIIKKRKINSIHNKQVLILMTIFSVIYVTGYYLLGLYFGYYESTVKLTIWSMFNYIIPFTFLILSSEIIRHIFISQNNKTSKLVAFLATVLIDLIIYTGIYDITSLDGFLTIIGFILFASVSCNLLYNYISIRFGVKPIIIYRLITTLYMYIIPITPDIYIFFQSFLRMIYPYLIYIILEYTYAKTNFVVAYKDKRKNVIGTSILILVMVSIIMLVSCQFRYGILVIGSNSMKGEINKGDTVVYGNYKNQIISKNDILIFKKDGIKIVHRVIEIKNVNGEYHYITKGDANEKMDNGYITKKDIVGIVKFKVKYLGYPTLWVRDIFSD